MISAVLPAPTVPPCNVIEPALIVCNPAPALRTRANAPTAGVPLAWLPPVNNNAPTVVMSCVPEVLSILVAASATPPSTEIEPDGPDVVIDWLIPVIAAGPVPVALPTTIALPLVAPWTRIVCPPEPAIDAPTASVPRLTTRTKSALLAVICWVPVTALICALELPLACTRMPSLDAFLPEVWMA